MGQSVLIVDDEALIVSSLRKVLAAEGFDVASAQSGRAALAAARESMPDAVVLDLVLGDMDGLEVLRELCREPGGAPPVILLTAHGSVDSAVAAMKAGAWDFVKKPFEVDELLASVRNALRTRTLERRVRYLDRDRQAAPALLGDSPELVRTRELVRSIAESPAPTVLLLGESGTGKGIAARLLHEQSERSGGQFVEINCAAIPDSLLEAELFGRERGAYSDAHERREGLVEVADGGTLFLDEIAELPTALQAKLLKFAEDRTFRRLGSNREHRVDARVVAATNRDLRAAVDAGRFRADLYYRLNEMTLTLPPLSARGDDIVLLARHFLAEASHRYRRRFRAFAPEAEGLLRAYRWPGNVRELRAIVNRVVLTGDSEQVQATHLPPEIAAAGALEEPALPPTPEAGPIPSLEQVETAYMRRVLSLCGGNRVLASRHLGIARQTLARRLNEPGEGRPGT